MQPGLSLHTRLLKRPAALILTSALLLSSGCTVKDSQNPNSSPSSVSTTQSDEATLHVAVIPARVPAEQEKTMKALADYLSKAVGQTVSFKVAPDYDSAVELLVTGKVEMAYLGPLTYVKAHARNPQVVPIVAPIDKLTGRPWYTSVIVANAARGINTLEDLKGKQFSFVSLSSTSGYLVPSVQLLKLNLNPQRDFAAVSYAGSHDKSVAAVVSGAVDAGAMDKVTYLKAQKEGKLPAPAYKVLWESDPIPTPPIVVSTKLPSPLVAELKKALINAPEGMLDVTGAESAGYTLVEDADYESVRQLQASLKLQQSQAK